MAVSCSGGIGAAHDKAGPEALDFGRQGPYEVGSTTLEMATGPVEVFYPAAHAAGVDAPPSSDGPFPVVLHSQDRRSDRRSPTRHLAHLAGWGLVAAAPDHPEGDPRPPAIEGAMAATLRLLTDATIERGNPLEGVIDTERVGVEGHGVGATTARAFAADPQVDVVAVLAPESTDPDATGLALGKPLLIIGAGDDTVDDLEGSDDGLDVRPDADVYVVVLADTGASALLDRPVIDHLTTARYLSILGADGGPASMALDPGFVAAAYPDTLSGGLRSSP